MAAVEVDSEPYEGVEVVRAEVTLAAGEPPGYHFGPISRGSLIGLINATERTFNP